MSGSTLEAVFTTKYLAVVNCSTNSHVTGSILGCSLHWQ